MPILDYGAILKTKNLGLAKLSNLIKEINKFERDLGSQVNTLSKKGIVLVEAKYFKKDYKKINLFEKKIGELNVPYYPN